MEENFIDIMQGSIDNSKRLFGDCHKVESIDHYKAMLPQPYTLVGNKRVYGFKDFAFHYEITEETLDGS